MDTRPPRRPDHSKRSECSVYAARTKCPMSEQIKIDWPEDEWQRVIAAGKQAILRAAELWVADFWGNLREEAPVNTARLAGSFQMSGGNGQWHIRSGVAYAMAVWKGTPPHVIEAKNKQ